MVTSTSSGLSVPDWPTTYGDNMFTFPLSKMVGGIFYEHGHRLIASTVGFLTIGLVFFLWRAESRPLGATARLDRARGRHPAGPAWRPDGDLPAAGRRSRSATPGSRRFSACLTITIALVHVARLAGAGVPADRRRRASAAVDRDDVAHLRPDPRGRDDASHRRRAGDSGLPARVRARPAADLDRAHRDSLRPSHRRARRRRCWYAPTPPTILRSRHTTAPSWCDRRGSWSSPSSRRSRSAPPSS